MEFNIWKDLVYCLPYDGYSIIFKQYKCSFFYSTRQEILLNFLSFKIILIISSSPNLKSSSYDSMNFKPAKLWAGCSTALRWLMEIHHPTKNQHNCKSLSIVCFQQTAPKIPLVRKPPVKFFPTSATSRTKSCIISIRSVWCTAREKFLPGVAKLLFWRNYLPQATDRNRLSGQCKWSTEEQPSCPLPSSTSVPGFAQTAMHWHQFSPVEET